MYHDEIKGHTDWKPTRTSQELQDPCTLKRRSVPPPLQPTCLGVGVPWDKPTIGDDLFDTTAPLFFLLYYCPILVTLKIEGVCWPGMCASPNIASLFSMDTPPLQDLGHNFIIKNAFQRTSSLVLAHQTNNGGLEFAAETSTSSGQAH